MTYSPYKPNGKCKEAGEVERDIADISQRGFTSVRLYGTDCNGLYTIGDAAQRHRLKIVAGVFIDETGIEAARPQIQALIDWGRWSLLELMVIGNEAISNGHCTATDLALFIADSKTRFRQAGYMGPCTTTESTVLTWKTFADRLCPVVDVVGANLHPFFNDQIASEEAGTFLVSEMESLGHVCGGGGHDDDSNDNKKKTYKGFEVFVLETGWPSAGRPNGKAVPGIDQQRVAIEAIKKVVGGKVAFFSYL